MSDERYYELVLAEISKGFVIPALRAKAFAEADGVETKAQALYLRYRASQIRDQERAERKNHSDLLKQKKHEAAMTKQLLRKQKATQAESLRIERAEAEKLTPTHYAVLSGIILIFIVLAFFAGHK